MKPSNPDAKNLVKILNLPQDALQGLIHTAKGTDLDYVAVSLLGRFCVVCYVICKKTSFLFAFRSLIRIFAHTY